MAGSQIKAGSRASRAGATRGADARSAVVSGGRFQTSVDLEELVLPPPLISADPSFDLFFFKPRSEREENARPRHSVQRLKRVAPNERKPSNHPPPR